MTIEKVADPQERQRLKIRLLTQWERDGFVRKGSALSRRIDGLTQIIHGQVTSIGTLQIGLRIYVHAVDPKRTPATGDFHIGGSLGISEGTDHIDQKEFQLERIKAMSNAELKAWAFYAYETAIKSFFGAFGSEAECAKLILGGAADRMAIIAIRPYRDFLGIPRPTGKWEFLMHGHGHVADPIEYAKKVRKALEEKWQKG